MKPRKLLVIPFFVVSVLVLTGSVSAQTTPSVQSFNVTSASFNPNAYPNAYDVSYSLANGSSASGVTVNADCHTGLTVQKMNDGGGLTSFTCGDIGAGGANGYFAYGAETLTLVFKNTTSQSISEAISLSAYGMNTVTKYVTVPPAPIPQVISFNVTPSASNPRGYPNAYDVSYALSNTSPASGVTVTVGCYQGMTVQTINDGGGLTPFTCGDIGAGGANGYFAYGSETRSFVFTNTNSQSISVSITLSAAGMNSVTKYVTVSPTPSVLWFTVTPSGSPYPNSYYVSWALSGVNQVSLTAGCVSGLTIVDPESGNTPFTCGDIDRRVAYGQGDQYLRFTNTTNVTINETITLSPVGLNSITRVVSIPSSFTPVTPTPTPTPTPQPTPTPTPSDNSTTIQLLLQQIQALQSQINSLKSQVSNTTPASPSGNQPTSGNENVPVSTCLDVSNNLTYRSRDVSTGGDVSALQDFLQAKGYLNSEPTGFFGVLTLKAAKDFQQANGISSTGFVGPITRAKIKALSCQ